MVTAAAVLQDHVVEQLGREIVDEVVHAGDSYTLEQIQHRFNVSRTVARDAMRSLESLGLVMGRRRVGLQVLDRSEWNVNHPRVIRLRLKGPGRTHQYRELAELRVAIEPYAARLAALRADDEQRQRLRRLAQDMKEAGAAGDLTRFLHLDAELHSLLLAACHNSHFGTMEPVVQAVLAGRSGGGVLPFSTATAAVADHVRLAFAVADGDADAAEGASRAVVAEVKNSLETGFDPEGSTPGP
ncbi:MAG: FadR/GntR family transcriptional regulator [Galactobacter sp.]